MRECRQKIKEWRQLQLHGLIAEDYASGGDSDCESRASNRVLSVSASRASSIRSDDGGSGATSRNNS